MRKVFWKSITGLSILLALSAFHVQNAASQETLLREYVNFFEHKIASGKVSTSHTKFYQTDGKNFTFITDFQPRLVAKMMGQKQYIQTTEVEFNGSEIKVLESTTEFQKSAPLHAEFDLANGKVVFNGIQEVQLPPNEIQVWSSWAASIMLKNPIDLIGQSVTIVDGDKLETYRYVELSEDTVIVNSKKLSTTRIKMEADGNSSFFFWITPEYSNFPIKMQKRDTGVRVNIELVTHHWES